MIIFQRARKVSKIRGSGHKNIFCSPAVGYRTLGLFRLNKMLETNDLSHREEAEHALVIRAETDFRFLFQNLTLIDMNQLYRASYKSTFGLHP